MERGEFACRSSSSRWRGSRAGCSEIDLDLAGIEHVWDLRAEIARRLPGLAPLMKNVMIAVNEEYAD